MSMFKRMRCDNDNTRKLNVFFLLSLFLAVGVLAGCGAQDDVQFTRRLMDSLIKGRYSVRTMIDWPSLLVMEDRNVGAEYRALPDDKERTIYERAFIEAFKVAFREKGGRFKAFFDWRVFSAKHPGVTIVAANCYDKRTLFLFGIKHEKGQRKLAEIKVLYITDPAGFAVFEKEQKSGI